MGKFEDVVREMREEGRDDWADSLEPFSATSLRKKAARSDELESRNAELEARIEQIEVLPKKLEALKELGVDVDSLRPLERAAIERAKVEKIDEAWAEKFVEDNQLPTSQVDRGSSEDTSAARIAGAARQAPAGGTVRGGAITQETVKGWSMAERLAFRQKNPEAWETLKDGGEVTGVAAP